MNENIKSAFKEIEAIKKSRMEILDLKMQQKKFFKASWKGVRAEWK